MQKGLVGYAGPAKPEHGQISLPQVAGSGSICEKLGINFDKVF